MKPNEKTSSLFQPAQSLTLLQSSLLPQCVAALLSFTLLLPGCGGSTKEAEAPEASNPPASDAAAEEPSTEAETPEEEAEPEEKQEEKASPRDILVREGTLFMLDHKKSDPGIQAEEACKKKSKDDVAKQANCVAQALNKMDNEGLAFDEDDDGNWWIIRFAIKNGVQVEYNRVQVEVGEPAGRKLTLKTVGRDKASRRKGTLPSELEFEVPDEYTVVWHEPKRGRLEFEPKLGLLGGQ